MGSNPLAKIGRHSRAVWTLVMAMAVTASAGQAQTITFEAGCGRGDRATIAAVGDLLFHKKLQFQAYRKNGTFKTFWAPVTPLLEATDFTYGNLEGPTAHGVSRNWRNVRDTGKRYGAVYNAELTPMMFNVHPSVIGELVETGFDVVSTANNHAFDRGWLGINRTIENLEAGELAFTGTRKRDEEGRRWSTVTRTNGFSIAWLACTFSTNGPLDRYDQVIRCYKQREQVLEEIAARAAEPDVDAVILVPHWGVENSHKPLRRQRALARAALEAGAAAVIGTHPHVIQPWEKHLTERGAEGLIVYSTGNFISNQRRLMERSGIIAVLELVRREGGKAQVAAAGYVPTWVAIDGKGHRVTVNTGTGGWRRSALRQTRKILPAGNHVSTGVSWPLNLPRDCHPGH